MDFLEVRNDKGDDDVCRELIRISLIDHVYIELINETSLVIEYRHPHGHISHVHETFDSPGKCHVRFNEIRRIISKGDK